MRLIRDIQQTLGSQNESITSRDLLRTILWQQDPQLLAHIRTHFLQQKLLAFGRLGDQTRPQKKMAFYEYLTLLPYFAGTIPSTLTICDQKYQVTPVPLLNPKWYCCPSSQVYAYGVSPIEIENNDQTKAYLLFMGTTYPGCPGFWQTIMADMMPLMNVGAWFQTTYAYNNLQSWLQDKKNVTVAGVSLGGSMAGLLGLELLAHTQDSTARPIKEIVQIKPTGMFYGCTSQKAKIQSLCKKSSAINYETYTVVKDIVSNLGQYPNEVQQFSPVENINILERHGSPVAHGTGNIENTNVNNERTRWLLNTIVEPVLRILGLPIVIMIGLYEVLKNTIYRSVTHRDAQSHHRVIAPQQCAFLAALITAPVAYTTMPVYLQYISFTNRLCMTFAITIVCTILVYVSLKKMPRSCCRLGHRLMAMISLLLCMPLGLLVLAWVVCALLIAVILLPVVACFKTMFQDHLAVPLSIPTQHRDETKPTMPYVTCNSSDTHIDQAQQTQNQADTPSNESSTT